MCSGRAKSVPRLKRWGLDPVGRKECLFFWLRVSSLKWTVSSMSTIVSILIFDAGTITKDPCSPIKESGFGFRKGQINRIKRKKGGVWNLLTNLRKEIFVECISWVSIRQRSINIEENCTIFVETERLLVYLRNKSLRILQTPRKDQNHTK